MRKHAALILVLLLGVIVRVPFWAEALRTPVDGDTAIVGLMARHLGRGTTLWGQPYGSPLEAWLAAPFVAALGPTAQALRIFYLLLGLALIPVAYSLGHALDPRAALPAAAILACPPPYFLLLSGMPPPLYPLTLILCGVLLWLALRLGERLAAGERPLVSLALWGALAGLALWTHLMSASAVLAGGVFLWRRARGGGMLVATLVALLATSAPWWARVLRERGAARIVSVSGREQTMGEHLREVLPALHRPLGGLLGTHVPVVADEPEHVVSSRRGVAVLLVLVYGLSVIASARRSRGRGPAGLLLAAALIALVAFPFPLRAGPHSIRFLTPLYLPVAALVAWAAVMAGGARRAWVVVLSLAGLHLLGSARLLGAWRSLDRSAPPFLLPDLGAVRRVLEVEGIRRAFASYGPAYRITYESGERIIASQPWNERFLHYPLPYLDEVRFAQDVAWILTPAIPTDLPAPRAFEDALGAAGGKWQRTQAGPAVIYHSFVPPFSPMVEPLRTAGAAGDGDPATWILADPVVPTTFALDPPRALDALTLVSGTSDLRLLRSMDVEVSADGVSFETVARRRRRDERSDLRWVNGHPQYVIDHDLLAMPLSGRTVAALRITPVASSDVWALAEVLLHPATDARGRPGWDEWLDPHLSWAGRRRALAVRPLPEREEWYYRLLLASHHR